jgi:hypothetical protein
VDSRPVPTENVPRVGPQCPKRPRWREAKQRVDPEQLVTGAEVTRSSEGIGADEDSFFGPPESRLPPAEAVDQAKRVEWRYGNPLERHAEERHAEARGQRRAITVMPVEELNDTGRLAERQHTLLHAVCIQRIDEPDAVTREQRV